MPTQNVNVQYTPANAVGQQWSQVPPKVHVPPGQTTTINWGLQVIPASAGSIVFSTANSSTVPPTPAGIVFNSNWTGSAPGPALPPPPNNADWTAQITNNLLKGDDPVTAYYAVNAVYTPSGGTAVPVQFDPEVESDPPTLMMAP